MVSSVLFWTSVVMFPRTYWMIGTFCLKTGIVIGKFVPIIIKKIIDKNNNALESPTRENHAEAQDSL